MVPQKDYRILVDSADSVIAHDDEKDATLEVFVLISHSLTHSFPILSFQRFSSSLIDPLQLHHQYPPPTDRRQPFSGLLIMISVTLENTRSATWTQNLFDDLAILPAASNSQHW